MDTITIWSYDRAPDDYEALCDESRHPSWVVMSLMENADEAYAAAERLSDENSSVYTYELAEYGSNHAIFVVYIVADRRV